MNLYQWLIQSGHELPKNLVEGKHSGHYFDENYCYVCNECVDEENDPDPCGTNWRVNKTNALWIEALKQIEAPNLVELEEGELKRVIREHTCEAWTVDILAEAIFKKFGKAKGEV